SDPSGAQPSPSAAQLEPGKLESANAQPAESAVRLVGVMRQFDMLQRAIEMIRALYSAASGMAAQQLNVDNIANNLANANTNGFKERRTQFQDLLYQSYVQPGAAAGAQTVVPSGLQVGLGTRPASNEIIFSEGNFQQTDNPLDLTIQGKGFFQVLLANGQLAYTRDGGFQLDRNGNVVNSSGNMIQPQITIPAAAQSIT